MKKALLSQRRTDVLDVLAPLLCKQYGIDDVATIIHGCRYVVTLLCTKIKLMFANHW